MQLDVSVASPQDAYALLVSLVAPRPIAWVLTHDRDGRTNLAPFSFFNAFGANPPVVGFSPTTKRDGSKKDTLRNIEETGEFVIHTAVEALTEAMNRSSRDLPYGDSEVEMIGLETVPSVKVGVPRLADAPGALECRLMKVVALGEGPLAGNLVLGEVVQMHAADGVLDGQGRVDPRRLRALGRLGGDWYARTSADIFTLGRPE